MSEAIYHKPAEYDLEHACKEADVRFYVECVRQWQPRRILELGCGTGRVTLPMASLNSRGTPGEVVGLDAESDMLKAAVQKARETASSGVRPIRWIEGDMRHWRAEEPFDLIVAPCGTLCHLLSVEDQIATWATAHANLNPGGRFVAETPMAEFARFAESMQVPPRAILEIDNDASLPQKEGSKRQLRYKTVLYDAAQQCASVRFLYDEFQRNDASDHFVSDYEHHVYYPREMELLFRMSGFVVESVWGDFQRSSLANTSRQLIMVGRKAR